MAKRKTKPFTPCPRCRVRVLGDYPALSRTDNKTEICGQCGTWEAMFQFSHKGKLPKIADGLEIGYVPKKFNVKGEVTQASLIEVSFNKKGKATDMSIKK